VQSVAGCMGGPETEVELGGRGVAGSVMTPRMHQSNGRRSFIIFQMQISRHLSHFHLQLNQLQDMVTFCNELSVLYKLFIIFVRPHCETCYQFQIAFSSIGLHKEGTRL
jgi:hypothetical protein